MKQLLTILLLFCICLPSVAQSHHEISVNGGAGLSSLQYSHEKGSHNSGFGGTAGINYQFYFNPQWSLLSGVDLGFYNSDLSINEINHTRQAISEGVNFDFTYAYKNYTENISATLLNIPIMAQFQTIGRTAFFSALGVKLSIPVTASYRFRGDLATKGYFPHLNVSYDNLPDYGLGNYEIDDKNNLDLNVGVMLSVEAGVKYRIDEVWGLSASAYFDYGLTNLNKAKENMVNYQPSNPSMLSFNSIADNSKKLYPMAVGIKLRINFDLNGYKAKKAQK